MLKLAWEPGYDRFYNEAKTMARKHWDEVGSHKEILDFNPDHNRYRALERADVLKILCARVDGKLIGYLLVLTMMHPRDIEASTASDDSIYVDPAYRKLMVGPKMIRMALKLFEDMGINLVFLRLRVWREQSDADMRRLGFEPHEVVYAKVLNRTKGVRRESIAV